MNSRLTTRRVAVTDMFEQMENEIEGKRLLKDRLYQEVALMQLGHWLRLEEPSFDCTAPQKNAEGKFETTPAQMKLRRSFKKLYCPDTGSRLLMNASTKGTEQDAHVDYYFNKETKISDENDAFALPPYFAEITTSQPTPMWLLEDSHKLAGKPWRKRQDISYGSPLRLKYIPQWSIFISRGDNIHGGGSGRMAAKLQVRFPGTCRCPRLHLYMGRLGVPLPDSINIPHASTFIHKEQDKNITSIEKLLKLILKK